MISVSNLGLSYGGKKLFDDVNIKFMQGNCYGLIGANGSGKTTFIKLLSGEISSFSGDVSITQGDRLSMLRQDHFSFNEVEVLKTVLMGNGELFKIMEEKEQLYSKENFSEEDGMRAAILEEQFEGMNGWEVETEGAIILAGLGLQEEINVQKMKELTAPQKIKVLLAQALFGKPDILLLDEPTNHLDIKAIRWLENFLLNFKNTVIVVSHDRHFLNKVCTHIADIDFGKISSYAGNYDFWKRSSELALRLRAHQNKKTEDKAAELKQFIKRFSANASKSKQATSRQRQLEKLNIEDLPVSSRKYPYINFEPKREAGKDILRVEGLSKTIDGVKILDNISFTVDKGDKIVLLNDNDLGMTVLFKILTGKLKADKGFYSWGITTTCSYFPSDHTEYFQDNTLNLIDWLREYSENKEISFIRGFLGRMLFSGEEALKKIDVLSGGEKVRCMLSKMMLEKANVLLFDGPTNHLDLESISALNDGLLRFHGTMLFTSDDHEFTRTIADRIIEIKQGRVLKDKKISYEDYLNEE